MWLSNAEEIRKYQQLKIGTPVTPTLGNVHTNLGSPFCLWVKSPYRKQSERQTGGQARPAMWHIRMDMYKQLRNNRQKQNDKKHLNVSDGN